MSNISLLSHIKHLNKQDFSTPTFNCLTAMEYHLLFYLISHAFLKLQSHFIPHLNIPMLFPHPPTHPPVPRLLTYSEAVLITYSVPRLFPSMHVYSKAVANARHLKHEWNWVRCFKLTFHYEIIQHVTQNEHAGKCTVVSCSLISIGRILNLF